MKKFLAMLVAITMTLTALPVTEVSAEEPEVQNSSYTIYPTPRSIVNGSSTVDIQTVNLVLNNVEDTPTVNRIKNTLDGIGSTYKVVDEAVDSEVNIILETITDDNTKADIAAKYSINDLSALDELEGYVIEIKNNNIVIVGSEVVATFYGVLSFEQMATSTTLNDVLVNDYSDNKYRGTVEGFYGVPWSHESRKEIIQTLGDFKMNQYQYAPKDDPYHFGPDWAVPYPEAELSQLRELVEIADESHVEFVYTLHISADMDLTDADDEINKTLPEIPHSTQWNIRGNDNDRGVNIPEGQREIDKLTYEDTWNGFVNKFEQLYSIGVRRFGILADDINFPQARYSAPHQVALVNALNEYFMTKYDDIEPIIFVPTYYYQADVRYNGASYMGFIKDGKGGKIVDGVAAEGMDPSVEVMWTGNHVMSNVNHTNNKYLVDSAGREPLVWWNYPVTDYAPSYILLGPNPGLEANATNMSGVIANPMQQGSASRISLFGVADYSWNMADYDRMESWRASFSYLFPEVADSLYLISQHATQGYNREITVVNEESVELSPYLDAFKNAVEAKDENAIKTAGDDLTREMDKLMVAVADVENNIRSQEMLKDIQPWLDKLVSISEVTKSIVEAYTTEDSETMWDAYSNVHQEVSNWPNIVVEQLAGGTVTAEIGIREFKPFVDSMIKTLEADLNGMLLTGDKTSTITETYANITDLEADVTAVDGVYTLSTTKDVTLDKYRYVGIKFDEAIYLSDITLELSNKSNLTIQYSVDGVNWNDFVEGEETAARYVRAINLTDKTITTNIDSLEATARGGKNVVLKDATTNTGVYQNNGPKYLMDGDLTTSYWVGGNQVPGQEAVLEFEEAVELYDFALFESTSDFIRRGNIYISEDGQNWEVIQEITNNFTVEEHDGENYNVIRGFGNGVKAKFVKIVTESTANNWTRLFEFEFNKNVDEFTGKLNLFNTIKDGNVQNLIDDNIKTAFTTSSDEDFLRYQLTDFTNANELVILQNAGNITDARVIVETTKGDVEVGTLASAYNSYDLATLDDVLAVRIEWVNDVKPLIHEIYTNSDVISNTALVDKLEATEKFVSENTLSKDNMAAYEDAKAFANAVINNDKATNGLINEAILKLDQVINYGDLEELKSLIIKAENIDVTPYTEESVKVFHDALDAAKAGLEISLTKERIATLISDLETAIDNLELSSEKPVDPAKPEPPTDKDKDGVPGTGINNNSITYVAIFSVAAVALLLVTLKKRKNNI